MTDKRHSIKGDPAYVAAEQERSDRWGSAAIKLGQQMTPTPEEIVKRLRDGNRRLGGQGVTLRIAPSPIELAAASLIESQQEEIKRLREALEPFANLMLIDEGGLDPDEVELLRRDWEKVCPDAVEDILIEVGWVKAARAALKGDVKE